MVWLLERFTTNPALARHEARLKLRFQNERATDLFALTVLLCDGFLRLNQVSSFLSNSVQNDSERFFSIAQKLPMELQMILCHRAVGSNQEVILSQSSEPAFQSLVQFLLRCSQDQTKKENKSMGSLFCNGEEVSRSRPSKNWSEYC